TAVVDVAGVRRVETVAGKLDAIEHHATFTAHVPREDDALAVRKRLRLTANRRRDRRMRRRLHAEHAHRLKILTLIARRLHPPRVEMIGDVFAGKPETFAEN